MSCISRQRRVRNGDLRSGGDDVLPRDRWNLTRRTSTGQRHQTVMWFTLRYRPKGVSRRGTAPAGRTWGTLAVPLGDRDDGRISTTPLRSASPSLRKPRERVHGSAPANAAAPRTPFRTKAVQRPLHPPLIDAASGTRSDAGSGTARTPRSTLPGRPVLPEIPCRFCSPRCPADAGLPEVPVPHSSRVGGCRTVGPPGGSWSGLGHRVPSGPGGERGAMEVTSTGGPGGPQPAAGRGQQTGEDGQEQQRGPHESADGGSVPLIPTVRHAAPFDTSSRPRRAGASSSRTADTRGCATA